MRPAAACATRCCACRSRRRTSWRWCGRCSPGRVCFHEGTSQVAPGILVHKIGGHSKGLQCVSVKTKRGTVVLASDATHLYSHIDGGRVFPITYNVGEVLDGYETIKQLAPSAKHIVPGHDPQVLQRYPAARPGLEGWVARLDVDPKA